MEVILGIVVFVALVSVILGVAWLSSRLNIRVGDYKLHIVFDDIGTLHAGDPVNVKGIKVGKVLRTELHLGKPSAYVAIWDAPEGGIPRDSQFWLKSESLLGGYIVDIALGDSPETIASDEYVSGRTSVGLESLAPEAKRLSERLADPKIGALSDANLHRIESTLASLDSATAAFHQLLTDNQRPLNTLLDSLGGAASEAKGMLGENRTDVKQVLRQLAKASSRLDSVTANLGAATGSLRNASDNLRDITQRVRQGDGTVGKLLTDEQLYRDMRRTLSQVDSILVDLKQNPGRYLPKKISIF
jgi:phospholipid/cholesterol/gamma-HCH transport system substrate-binding protein